MSTISFSGLSSGLDTESIISSLMEIERVPIARLENDQEYLQSRLDAYTSFDTYLNSLLEAVAALDSSSELNACTANLSGDEIAATASSTAQAGTYTIEVLSLARQQKDVTAEGFADTVTADLAGMITIGEETLGYENLSLSELVETINGGEYGVSASLINDGTENGYRMVLTADRSGTAIEIVATGSIVMETAAEGHTQESSQAHIVVDNIDIYSNQNVISTAIDGVTLDIMDVSGTNGAITLTVSLDRDAIAETVQDFVTAYNNVIQYIADQNDADWGNETEFRSIRRSLQNFLSTRLDLDSSFTALADLGLETNYKTGQISLDTKVFKEAIESDFEGVQKLFLGNGETEGITTRIQKYLDAKTDSRTGMLAIKEDSTEANIDRIDEQIERLEARLEKREESLYAQFTALETLLSELNSQSDYLTNWISSQSED